MKKVKVVIKQSQPRVKVGDIIEFELNGEPTRDEVSYVGRNCIEGLEYDLTKLVMNGTFKIVSKKLSKKEK